MLVQLAVAAAAALALSPCVLQLACPSPNRSPRPPSSVCMHRLTKSSVAVCVGVPAPRPAMTTSLPIFLALATIMQVTSACKNCVVLGKAEKAMFRAHSDACLAYSQVEPKLVESLLNGELSDEPALRRHVYCVLHKCKVVGKDGKLLKTAVLGKLAMRADGKNASKILENCADQSIDLAPEDAAWNLFRCGYDRKAVIFDYMPTDKQPAAE